MSNFIVLFSKMTFRHIFMSICVGGRVDKLVDHHTQTERLPITNIKFSNSAFAMTDHILLLIFIELYSMKFISSNKVSNEKSYKYFHS